MTNRNQLDFHLRLLMTCVCGARSCTPMPKPGQPCSARRFNEVKYNHHSFTLLRLMIWWFHDSIRSHLFATAPNLSGCSVVECPLSSALPVQEIVLEQSGLNVVKWILVTDVL